MNRIVQKSPWLIYLTVFISGAAVMLFEITGSRLLAPHVGMSTFVWTSLIGVILASLSLGYWYGGILADRQKGVAMLANLLAASAISVCAATYFAQAVCSWVLGIPIDLKYHALLCALLLFPVPSAFFGTILPICTRMLIRDFSKGGETIGRVYALSTIGSLTGTFCSGFVLLPLFGSDMILYFTAGTLLILAALVAVSPKKWFFLAAALAIIWFGQKPLNLGYVLVDSAYNRISVYDVAQNSDSLRYMRINNQGSTAIYLNRDDLVNTYARFFMSADLFHPTFKSALMLGGAGYAFPKAFVERFGGTEIDVIEIDPAVTNLAERYFDLKQSDALRVIHADGRTFLNRTDHKYDLFFGDAFNALYAIPFHLTTLESVEKIHEALNDEGVAMINLLISEKPGSQRFLNAQIATFEAVFKHVFLFPMGNLQDGVQNYVLVASKVPQEPNWRSPDPQINDILAQVSICRPEPNAEMLTDRFAPVEYWVYR